MKRQSIIQFLVLAVCLVLLLALGTSAQEQMTVVGWNVESGDASVDSVAARIAAFDGVDIWGLCEVYADRAEPYEHAAEQGENADFSRVLGSDVSFGIRLLILYDNDRLELVNYEELNAINVSGTVRAPLVAQFRLRSTGDQFKFMVNHLYRGDQAGRVQQSTMLHDWAQSQTIPVIACGDYNYDWKVVAGEIDHDLGYDQITQDGVWKWIRPAMLAETQYSPSYAPSVLDFVFLAHDEGVLTGASQIITQPGDFPDSHSTPDRRPILAQLTFGAGAGPHVTLKQTLLARIAQLEQEVAALKQLVNSLPD